MGLIYMATNTVNGKSYIGLTMGTLENRKKGHIKSLSDKNINTKFKKALKKYGVDNFIWNVLEDSINNLDELFAREIYYIDKYKTFYKGYNMTLGGDGVGFGENNPNSKYTEEIIENIINLIINTDLNQLEISRRLNIPRSLVKDVNSKNNWGHCWKGKENPRKIKKIKLISDDVVMDIIKDLKSFKYSDTEISKKYGVNRQVVNNISCGKTYIRLWNGDYDKYKKLKEENKEYLKGDNHVLTKYSDTEVDNIIQLICETTLSYKEISEISKVPVSFVTTIANKKGRVDRWKGKENPRKNEAEFFKKYSVENLEKVFVLYFLKGLSANDISKKDLGLTKSEIKSFVSGKIKKRVYILENFKNKYKNYDFVNKPKGKPVLTYELSKVIYVEYFINKHTYDEIVEILNNEVSKTTVHAFITNKYSYTKNWFKEFEQKYGKGVRK